MRRADLNLLFTFLFSLVAACTPPDSPKTIESVLDTAIRCAPLPEEEVSANAPLKKMGYAVQVGAFSKLDNAVRFEESLQCLGVDAYSFRHESGLYKVRFGDYASYREAERAAAQISAKGLIGDYFIVRPEDYSAARIQKSRKGDLRLELVTTAERFLGVPYVWGGESAKTGFDCSGLTMSVYRLNGLKLPRNSRSQFASGRWIPKKDLKKGDLVFFATNGGKRVSHVGLYIGEGKFIHAPRKGKTVRVERLDNTYFAKRYMGGRTYL